MLRLDVRDLRSGPVSTSGTLQPDDPALADTGLVAKGPVTVDGVLQRTPDGDYFWRGHFRAAFAAECRRCLADVTVRMDDDVETLLSANPDLAEDPSVYAVDPGADVIDLTPVVREEIILRVSAFSLCRPDCRGLCAKCGADLNAGPCACMSGSTN